MVNPTLYQSMPANPRYLLELPTFVTAARIWNHFGWSGGALGAIQTLRSLIGVVGIVFFFLTIYELSTDVAIAGITSFGLGLSLAFWTYSTHIDHGIVMVSVVSLVFYLFVISVQRGKIDSLGVLASLACLLAIATLYNETASLVTVAMAVAIALAPPRERTVRRLKRSVLFLFFSGMLTAVVGGTLISVWIAPSNLGDVVNVMRYANAPELSVGISLADAGRAALGLGKAFVSYPGVRGPFKEYWNQANPTNRLTFLLLYGSVVTFATLPFFLYRLKRTDLEYQTWLLALLTVWFGAFFVFNWRWDPTYIKYWVIVLLPCWTMVALVLKRLATRFPSRSNLAATGVALYVFIAFLVNLSTYFLPDSLTTGTTSVVIAEAVGNASDRNALFVSVDPQDTLSFYIAYFAERDILSIPLVRYGSSGNEIRVRESVSLRAQQHRQVGGKVYAFGIDSLDQAGRSDLLGLLHASSFKVAWTFPERSVYEAVP